MKLHLSSILIALLSLTVAGAAFAADPGPSPAAQPPAAGEATPAPDLLPPSTAPGAEPTKPITGAFGLRLGERFVPETVAMVLAEEPHTYRRWDNAELQGTRYHVEPYERSACFQTYQVLTNQDGIIYSIRAEYLDAEKQSTCKAVTAIADELRVKYGRPRGHGSYGEIWFSFRDIATNPARSLRLYGHRCKGGRYTIMYSDDKLQRGSPPPKAETPAEQAPEASAAPAGEAPAVAAPATEPGGK
jgi:hypothetical protein